MNPVPSEIIRSCGTCSVCCYVSKVDFSEVKKPPHKRCLHVIDDRIDNRTGSCGIFGQDCRPSECQSFICSWLGGMGNEDDRPDKTGVMLSINALNGGTWIFAIETKENAIKTTGKNIVLDVVKKVNLPMIVSSYDKLPPFDTGDKVVVKASLLSRSKFLIGEKLDELSDDVSIYRLIDSMEKND